MRSVEGLSRRQRPRGSRFLFPSGMQALPWGGGGRTLPPASLTGRVPSWSVRSGFRWAGPREPSPSVTSRPRPGGWVLGGAGEGRRQPRSDSCSLCPRKAAGGTPAFSSEGPGPQRPRPPNPAPLVGTELPRPGPCRPGRPGPPSVLWDSDTDAAFPAAPADRGLAPPGRAFCGGGLARTLTALSSGILSISTMLRSQSCQQFGDRMTSFICAMFCARRTSSTAWPITRK